MFCSPLPHWTQPRQRNSLPQPGYRKEAAGPGCTSGSFWAFPAAANSVRAQNALPSMERGVVHKMHGQEPLDCKAFPHNFSLQLLISSSIYWHSLPFLTFAERIVCPLYLGGILLDWATRPGDSVMPVMPFNLIYPSNILRRYTTVLISVRESVWKCNFVLYIETKSQHHFAFCCLILQWIRLPPLAHILYVGAAHFLIAKIKYFRFCNVDKGWKIAWLPKEN